MIEDNWIAVKIDLFSVNLLQIYFSGEHFSQHRILHRGERVPSYKEMGAADIKLDGILRDILIDKICNLLLLLLC